MGYILKSKGTLQNDSAKLFRQHVLEGAGRLTIDEVRSLADELHACARQRRTREITAAKHDLPRSNVSKGSSQHHAYA